MSKILIFSFLFILTGCLSKGDPEMSSLGNMNHPEATEADLSVSVNVSGLSAEYLTLKNGKLTFPITSDGLHHFSNVLKTGDLYHFELFNVSPMRNCILKNSSGVARNNITLDIYCTISNSYYVSGKVNGLEGELQLTLKDNGVDVSHTTVTSGGRSFAFPYSMAQGQTYSIAMAGVPGHQSCTIKNQSGIIETQNIDTINIICSQNLSLTYSVSLTVEGSSTGSLTLLTSAPTNTEQTVSFSNSSPVTRSLNGFIQGRRHILEIKNSTSDSYCYFDTTKSFQYHGSASHTNVSNVKIKCQPRLPCTAISGEVISPFGPIKDIACKDDALYIASDSDYIGKNLGTAWTFPLTQPTPDSLRAFDRINGYVNSAVPDQTGGWFVAGNFTQIGDKKVHNLVRLFNDMTIDESFNIRTDGTVNALFIKDQVLYLGGSFTRVMSGDGPGTIHWPVVTNGLAAIDLSQKPYAPTNLSLNLDYQLTINSLNVSDQHIILEAYNMGYGNSIFKMASIPRASGVVKSSDLNVLIPAGSSDYVSSLHVYGNSVYYQSNSGIYKKNILDLTTTFIQSSSNQIVGYKNKLYFSDLNELKELNLDTNTTTPLLTNDNNTYGMSANGEMVCGTTYEGGTVNIGMDNRTHLYCVNLATKKFTTLNSPDQFFQKIHLGPDSFLVTGHYGKKIPTSQANLFKVNLASNTPDPYFSSGSLPYATSLVLDTSFLYVAGNFGGGPCLKRLDPTTGTVDGSYYPVTTQSCGDFYNAHSMKIRQHQNNILYTNNTEYRIFDESGVILLAGVTMSPIEDAIAFNDNFVISTFNNLTVRDYTDTVLYSASKGVETTLAPLPNNQFLAMGNQFPSGSVSHFDQMLNTIPPFHNANFEFAFTDGDFLLTQSPGGNLVKRDALTGSPTPISNSFRLEGVRPSQARYMNGSLFIFEQNYLYNPNSINFKIIQID